MKESPKFLISCVGENTPKFHRRVLNLFRTLKKFGGKLNDQQKVALFVDSIDNQVKIDLHNLGVKVHVVQRVDPRNPNINKIRMLEIEDEYDVLIALDCDLTIVRDFSTEISSDFLQVKPVDYDPLTMDQWEFLFSFFGIPLPAKRYKTTAFPSKVTIPYFNTGVLTIPKVYVNELKNSWKKYIALLLDSYLHLGDIEKYNFHTNQFAFSLVLGKENFPIKPFPIEMNFPTHIKTDPDFSPDEVNPFILHYHNNVNEHGQLNLTGYNRIDKAIKMINSFIVK